MSITINELKNNLDQIFQKVVKTKEPVVISDQKEPGVVIVDYSTYNIFSALLEELELKGRFLEAYSSTRKEPKITLKELKTKYGLA
jgi:prevent-host-death family protein